MGMGEGEMPLGVLMGRLGFSFSLSEKRKAGRGRFGEVLGFGEC